MLQKSCQNISSIDTKVENQGDIVVRSEDFFSAIHTINGNKQNRQRMSGSGAEVKVSNFWYTYFLVDLKNILIRLGRVKFEQRFLFYFFRNINGNKENCQQISVSGAEVKVRNFV